MKKTLLFIFSLLSAFVLEAQEAPVVASFPWEEGFEDVSSLSSWTIIDNNGSTSDNWSRVSSYSYRHGGNYGIQSSYNSSASCNEWLVSPSMQLPADAEGFTLKWWVKGSSYDGNMAHYVVLVFPASNAAALQPFDSVSLQADTLWAESYGVAAFAERSVSIESYAGQTICIAFVHDGFDDDGLCIDDISVSSVLVPVVSIVGPAQASEGEVVRFLPGLIEGSSSNLGYSWSSTMEANGLASFSYNGDTLEIVYSAGGTDTITLIASNSYGEDTATTTIFVCGAVTVFPWSEGFEDAATLSCWTILDFNGYSGDNWNRYSSSVSHSGSYSVRSSYSSSVANNEWLVTPSLLIPDDASGFVLKWCARGSSYSGNVAHYTVLVSTSGTDTNAFTDTLFAESHGTTTYLERSVSLAAYAGQAIRVAFIHDSFNDNGLLLDDIAVYSALLPSATIAGPSLAFEGDTAWYVATLLEGDDNGLLYTWSSSMENQGLATTVMYNDTLGVIYYTGGIDTVTCIVSNSYGADTLTATTRVCGSIATFPWGEDFEDTQNLTCWSLLDLNVSTSDNWSRYTGSSYAHSGSGSARSNYNYSSSSNEWLVTPPMLLPFDGEGFLLKWWARGGTFSGNQTHYTVLVFPAANMSALQPYDSVALQADTLFAESQGSSQYLERSASLDAYLGQAVRIAFVHDSQNDNGLYIDDLSIYSAMPPSVLIVGPVAATVGEMSVYKGVITEGSADGAVYSWSSTMEDNALATLIPDGDSVQVIYSTGGIDTLQLVVSNSYGSDTAIYVVNVCGTLTELPWSESFSDANALSCWTLVDRNHISSDNWRLATSGGLQGGGCAYSNYGASPSADEWLITPAIEIPSDGGNYILSWQVKGSSYMGSVAHYTVLAIPVANASVLNLDPFDVADLQADTLYAESYDGAYALRVASITGLAGQTVRFAFLHDSYDDDGLSFDDITVRSAEAPVVVLSAPVQVFTGESVVFAASLSEGSTNGLGYLWSNTLGGSLLANGDSLVVVYSVGGTDTVTVIASNNAGADTAMAIVTVVDCPPVASLPWEEGFEDAAALDCWQTLDLDGNTNDNWTRNTMSNNVHGGSAAMRSYYNISAPANDWLVTPAIDIPSPADGVSLSWWVKGSAYSTNVSHYTVLVSTSGSDTASFTDTLFAEAYGGAYAKRSASLEDYAGQTVRIAFVHDSQNDSGLCLDDIAVSVVLLPVVTVSGPQSAFTGDAVAFAATLSEGSTAGIAYSWTNTLAGSTLTPNGDSLSIVYSQGGTDTIIVTATNAFGSAADTIVVQVVDCGAIASFPWSEGFESGAGSLQCWTIVDNNNFAADNWLLVNDASIAYEGSYCIGSPYREYGTNDEYIISPAVTLPSDATGLYLSYYVWGGEYEGNLTTYEVLISTSGTDVSDFVAVLSESHSGDYERHSVPLDSYGGQTIHFAFRHMSYDADNLVIDNITIDTFGTVTPPAGCPAPEIASVTESETSVTISWTGTAFGYEVAICSGNWVTPASGTSVLTTTYTFNSLSAATAYTVGVRSLCLDGTYSTWTTFPMVTASSSCQVPTDLESEGLTFDGVTLSWLPVGDESDWEVNVHCAQSHFDTLFSASAPIVTVDGLEPGRTYAFRVRALCSATSHSDWSATASFATPACNAPTGLAASVVTASGATLTWSANGALRYEVSYGIGTAPAQGTLLTAETNSLSLAQLEPSTTYSVYVRSYCTDGLVSGWSPRLTFTTSATQEGIDDAPGATVSMRPNPAADHVAIEGEGLLRVMLLDLSGRQLVASDAVDGAVHLDVAALGSGVYFVRLVGRGYTQVRKLVVTH